MDKFVYAIIAVVLWSCSAGMPDMEASDYMDWYAKNESLNRTRSYPGISFKATYKDAAFIYLLERNGRKSTLMDFEKKRKELGDLFYFNLKITGSDGRDLFTQYGLNDVNYPIDLLQDELSLVQGEDTLPCRLFHFERNYGLSPSANLSLAFEKGRKKDEDITLVFNDELFRTGLNKFRFSSSSIYSIPKLRLR